VTLPPDSSLDVHVVRGEERRAVQRTVGVTIHTASLPDEAYVYRNGKQPLPLESETRFGSAAEKGDHTVIRTYTDENGHVSVSTKASPGYWDRVKWLWRTTVPSFSLPFMLDVPSVPSIPGLGIDGGPGVGPAAVLPAVGVVTAASRRRAG